MDQLADDCIGIVAQYAPEAIVFLSPKQVIKLNLFEPIVVCEIATEYGHLELLKYAQKHGCKLNKHCSILVVQV